MRYKIVQYPMALSNFQGYAAIIRILECNFLYSCTAVDKISTARAHCTVPVQ